MIKYKQGDIIKAFEKGEIQYILHQTNCISGNKVAGFAKVLMLKYPELEKTLTDNVGLVNLGDVRFTHLKDGRTIVNIYSQYFPGAPSNNIFLDKKTRYKLTDCFYNRIISLNKALFDLDKVFNSLLNETQIGIPLIASGLAADQGRKGSLKDLEYFKTFIHPEIEKHFKLNNITVYYL